MQETHYSDGRIIRQFVQADNEELMREKLMSMHRRAIFDPKVKSVKQVKIGRNDICPCGSCKKFKKCCISRVEA